MDAQKPRRFYLITHPRTASNLLIKILALDDQPDVAPHRPGALGGYFFVPASRLEIQLGLRGKHIEEWSEENRKELKDKLQECFDSMEEYLDSAEAGGKIAFVKEHAYFLAEPTAKMALVDVCGSSNELPWTMQLPSKYGTELTRSSFNKTLFPDQFLQPWLPTFLIRHPALAFPSLYRVMMDVKTINPEKKNTFQFDMMMTYGWVRSLYDFWSEYLGEFGREVNKDRLWVNYLSGSISIRL